MLSQCADTGKTYRVYCCLFRFGSGYTVTIRVADQRSNITSLKEFIALTFAGIQLREEHRNVLHYHLAASGASLAQVFHHLELARNQYNIEDYSVSQTTLDQVSLGIIRAHQFTNFTR